jgi:isoquinoline 1-oxidoreductase alpha subunit
MIQLKVNGVDRSFNGDPEMPLLWYLRDELKLTGAKFGCGIALCGSCTVHKNGEAIRSCVSAMRDMAGADVLAKLLKRVIPCCRNVNSISP